MDGCANVPEQRFGKRATLYCASTGWHFTGAARSRRFARDKRVPNPIKKKKKIYHSAQDCLLSLIEFPRKSSKKKVEQESFECKEEIEDHVSDAQLRTFQNPHQAAAALTDVGLLYRLLCFSGTDVRCC